MFSLETDVADSVRGRAFKLVVIDEAALVKQLRNTWENAIRATLADHRGEAWLLSTPRGLNDFKLFYDRGQDPEREDWASWQMPTSSNPHISGDEIEAAQREMTEASFSQEFLAAFVTTGFNGKKWLDQGGHQSTDALRTTERFRRRDFGHLDIQFSVDDPKAYTKPWTLDLPQLFYADTELLEFVCNENEKDLKHMTDN